MTAVYRLLLRLCPPPFRARYATDILRALDDRRAAAAAAGRGSLVLFHLRAIADLLVTAAGERLGRPGPAGSRGPRHHLTLSAVAQDARFGLRMLRRRPALSFFSAATLALGIAAITTIASLIDAVLIQPLPFPRPSEIVAVGGVVEGRPAGISYENLRDIKARAMGLRALSPFFAQSVNLTGVAEPDRLRGGFVTSDFFDVVAITPALGRVFDRRVDHPGTDRVAVLADAAWRGRFGARPDILGQTIHLNNAPFTVVGVLAPGFRFPIDEVEVWLPFWTTTTQTDRGSHNYIAVGRVTADVTVQQASEEVAAIAATLERAYPELNRGRSARVRSFKDALVGEIAPLLQLLATMVGILLLVAAANVAGLQLGDTALRRREIAVRAALGAGRLRIARQIIFESVTRAAVGVVFGLLAARAAIGLLVANAPAGAYGIENAGLSLRVVLVSALVAGLAGIAAGLPAAFRWTTAGTLAGTGAGGRTTGDAATSRLRTGLVVCQVAFASLLLVAAGLTSRSVAQLRAVEAGFDASNVLTMEYRLPRNKYQSTSAQAEFHRQVLERVGAIPGVSAAAAVRALPFSGNGNTVSYSLAAQGEPRQATFNAVSPRYFDAMRIPVLAGRAFQRTEGQEPVVLVSRALARREWPGVNPIGRRVYFDEFNIVATVIGVVGDVRHRELAQADEGTIYTHQDQNPSVFNTLVVRTSGSPMALADAVRRAVWAVDSDQPVWKIRTLGSLVDGSTVTRRFLSEVVVFFGVSVAALALLGLYGVVASAVTQRTREIGVRVALGAPRDRVLALVLWTGVRPGLVGLILGLAGAIGATQLLRTVLFGIGPRDPFTFAAVAGLMLSAVLAACWVPARRALAVDPVNALRQE
jgi:putative ABC transport system permease protein